MGEPARDWRAGMGGVYKTRKDKYRIVADATRTGVNASMTRPKVQLDTLDDVVRDSFSGGWQVGIDLSECFLLRVFWWGRANFLKTLSHGAGHRKSGGGHDAS